HGALDILDLEADVVQALALLGDPRRGLRLLAGGLEQFQVGLTHGIHGDLRLVLREVLLVLHGQAELVLEQRLDGLDVADGEGDVLNTLDLHGSFSMGGRDGPPKSPRLGDGAAEPRRPSGYVDKLLVLSRVPTRPPGMGGVANRRTTTPSSGATPRMRRPSAS